MTPEAEDFLADCFLETVGKAQRHYHYGYADQGGDDRKADDKPGKDFSWLKAMVGYETYDPQ